MPLAVGDKLGHYEVLSLLGQGGMGEVYRARDTTLKRDVALKVVPAQFLRDLDRLARFHREAEVLASLDHPNIGPIFGLVESDGSRALVLALIEGPTLADHLEAGPLPREEAIAIAKQIIEALEYAHDRGVVHRDLKPSNVKITPEGVVKVLDFGLAKVLEDEPVRSSLTDSPTLTLGHTRAGVILGTAAYMSPEQAVGRPVDRRSDIFSFGAVLYEMLTGQRAFQGTATPDVLEAVVKNDPDWSKLSSCEALIRRCLTKDRKQRLQAIGEARIVLENPVGQADSLRPIVNRPPRFSGAWAAAAILAVIAATVSFLHFREKRPALAAVQRFEIAAPVEAPIAIAVVSPDGSRVAFSIPPARGTPMWVRPLDSLEAHPLPGTEDSNGIPFWSPDSRYVVFGTLDGKLKKIDIASGSVQVLCDATSQLTSGFWTPDDKIVFSTAGGRDAKSGLFEVPAGGGVAALLESADSATEFFHSPALLPDGRHFVYSRVGQFRVRDTPGAASGSPAIYLGTLDAKPGQNSKKLINDVARATYTTYAPSSDDPNLGYLLFRREPRPSASSGLLWAQLFDLRKLEVIGEPVLVSDRVRTFSASRNGILVYLPGTASGTEEQLTLFDKQGNVLETIGDAIERYLRLSFSPDGARVIAERSNLSSPPSLWMFDLARGLATRFTPNAPVGFSFPVWSPDGSRIAFAEQRDGKSALYQRLSNGGGEDELLFQSDEANAVISWSRDGRFLLIGVGGSTDAVLSLDAKGHAAGKPFVFVRKGLGTRFQFSPDPTGPPRWVAYDSNSSGRNEIYLLPFDPNSPTGSPATAGPWQVSKGGGVFPRWSGNGRQLFYEAPDGTVMAADVTANPKAPTGIAKPVFKPKGLTRGSNWDVSPDGNKFIFAIPAAASTATLSPFTVVLNWTSLLKK